MSGTAEHNIERVMNRAVLHTGRRIRHNMPVYGWRAGNQDGLSSSSSPSLQTIATSLPVIRWAFNASNANPIRSEVLIPQTFRDPDQASERLFTLYALARKRDTSADENGTLALNAQVSIYRNNARITLTSDPTILLPAAKIGDTTGTDGWTLLTYDVAAAHNSDSGNRIQRGDLVQILLYPSATVGTTDMVLEMKGAWIDWREHFVNVDTTLR